MKILNISDIRFPTILCNKSKKFIETYIKKSNNELSYLTNIIEKEKIELVLMAGDVMGDVSANYYANAFIWLLDYFEQNKVYCYFIAGNHDIDESYSKIVSSLVNYNYVKEISGQLVIHNNLKIFGLSYFHTENLTSLKSIISQAEPIDILLCHSQNKRIPFLFDLKSKYIVTGHFDLIFGNVFDQIIIAINMGCFAIIETSERKKIIKYYTPDIPYNSFCDIKETYVCKISKNNISFSSMLNTNCVEDLRILRAIKLEKELLGQITSDLKTKYFNRNCLPKISQSTQIQYLGKQLFDNVNLKLNETPTANTR